MADEPIPGAEVEDPDVAEDDERVRQAEILQQEKIRAFLDELSQLSNRFGFYIEGHGKDTFIIDSLTSVGNGIYSRMWERTKAELPEEVCWCPEDQNKEGLIDIDDVGI